MRFTKIWVDMVLASGEDFIVRYEYQTPGYRLSDGTRRPGQRRAVSTPIYARIVSSKSIQLYDIDKGSIRKAGNGVVSQDLMDFSNAVYQTDLMASSQTPAVPGP